MIDRSFSEEPDRLCESSFGRTSHGSRDGSDIHATNGPAFHSCTQHEILQQSALRPSTLKISCMRCCLLSSLLELPAHGPPIFMLTYVCLMCLASLVPDSLPLHHDGAGKPCRKEPALSFRPVARQQVWFRLEYRPQKYLQASLDGKHRISHLFPRLYTFAPQSDRAIPLGQLGTASNCSLFPSHLSHQSSQLDRTTLENHKTPFF
jgi:hypothetical protein